MGLGGICESDLRSAMTHIILQGLTGRPGFVSDPTVDESTDSIILAHCMGTRKMDGPTKPAVAVQDPDGHGAAGGRCPPGPDAQGPEGDPGDPDRHGHDPLLHGRDHRGARWGSKTTEAAGPRSTSEVDGDITTLWRTGRTACTARRSTATSRENWAFSAGSKTSG